MKPNYIIISGTSKAATTSLFKYVADHPEVCPSYVKQTNYFLDSSDQERLDLKSIERYDEDAKTYLNFYKCRLLMPLKEQHKLVFYLFYLVYEQKTVKKLLYFFQCLFQKK